eukprot:2403827-Amphidinium_carterae.2
MSANCGHKVPDEIMQFTCKLLSHDNTIQARFHWLWNIMPACVEGSKHGSHAKLVGQTLQQKCNHCGAHTLSHNFHHAWSQSVPTRCANVRPFWKRTRGGAAVCAKCYCTKAAPKESLDGRPISGWQRVAGISVCLYNPA